MKRVVALFTIAVFLLNIISPSLVFADGLPPDSPQLPWYTPTTNATVSPLGSGDQPPTPTNTTQTDPFAAFHAGGALSAAGSGGGGGSTLSGKAKGGSPSLEAETKRLKQMIEDYTNCTADPTEDQEDCEKIKKEIEALERGIENASGGGGSGSQTPNTDSPPPDSTTGFLAGDASSPAESGGSGASAGDWSVVHQSNAPGSGSYLYGDGDGDYVVDALDEQVRRSHFGNSGAPDDPLMRGDYNGDNKVDAADYVVWRKLSGQPQRAVTDIWLSDGDSGALRINARVVNGAFVQLVYNLGQGDQSQMMVLDGTNPNQYYFDLNPPPTQDFNVAVRICSDATCTTVLGQRNAQIEQVLGSVPVIGPPWPSWPSYNEIQIHAEVTGVPSGAFVKMIYNIGQGDQLVTMNPTGNGNEYASDPFARPTDGQFAVRIQVCQDEACTIILGVPKDATIINTFPIDIHITPHDISSNEISAVIRGEIDPATLPPNPEDQSNIVIKIFYWRSGDENNRQQLSPRELVDFYADDGLVTLTNLWHGTTYFFSFEAWLEGPNPKPVGISEVGVFGRDWVTTARIHPILDPSVTNVGQIDADFYAPIIQYEPSVFNVANVKLYIWDASLGTARPEEISPVNSFNLDALGSNGCPLFRAINASMPTCWNNGNPLRPAIQVTGLKDGVTYNYQFVVEVHALYAPPDDRIVFESPVPGLSTPKWQFTTLRIDPMINPHAVPPPSDMGTMVLNTENQVTIDLGTPSGNLPIDKKTAEVRIYIWEDGTSRPADTGIKCTFEDLELRKCFFRSTDAGFTSGPFQPGVLSPYQIYIDGLEDGERFLYEVEIWTKISLISQINKTNAETPLSAAVPQAWYYDTDSPSPRRPGFFETIPIQTTVDAAEVLDSNITEATAILFAENLANPPLNNKLVLVERCYRRQGSGADPTCQKETLENLINSGWAGWSISNLQTGATYDYWVYTYADYDLDSTSDRTLHTDYTTFTTHTAGFSVLTDVPNYTETTATITADVDELIPGTATEAFKNSLVVKIQYCEGNGPCTTPETTMTRCTTQDTGPLCLGDPMNWYDDLSSLEHLTHHTYTIRVYQGQGGQAVGGALASVTDSFDTLEIDFELELESYQPPDNDPGVTETTALIEAIDFVIPERIRDEIPLEIATVQFCFSETGPTDGYNWDCDEDPPSSSNLKIYPISLKQFELDSWQELLDQGLNHNTQYWLQIRIYTDEDENGIYCGFPLSSICEQLIHTSLPVTFRTEQIAPMAVHEPRNIMATEVDIGAPAVPPGQTLVRDSRSSSHPDYVPDCLDPPGCSDSPIVDQWGEYVNVTLFVWEDTIGDGSTPMPAQNVLVETIKLEDLAESENGWICDHAGNCVYGINREAWSFSHIVNLKSNTKYIYEIRFSTEIPGVPEAPLPGAWTGNFQTLPIPPVANPIDPDSVVGRVTETSVLFEAPILDSRSTSDPNYILPEDLIEHWGDLLQVRITFWPDGNTPPANPQILMTLKTFSEGYGTTPWSAFADFLEHDTTYHYRIDIKTLSDSLVETEDSISMPGWASETVFSTDWFTYPAGVLSFTTQRIQPEVIPNVQWINDAGVPCVEGSSPDCHQNIVENNARIHIPITQLPSRLDIAYFEIHFQTIRYQYRDPLTGLIVEGKSCQGGGNDAPSQTPYCRGEPVLQYQCDPDGSNCGDRPVIEEHVILKSLYDISRFVQNRIGQDSKPSSEWTIDLPVNHYSLYTYWIVMFADEGRNGNYTIADKVWDTRPIRWVNDTGATCAPGSSPDCHESWIDSDGEVCTPGSSSDCQKEILMRSVCVKDPRDNSTCWDSVPDILDNPDTPENEEDPATLGIQPVYYEEPDVDMATQTFQSKLFDPKILYAFSDAHSTNADIVANIDPAYLAALPENKDGSKIYELWVVYYWIRPEGTVEVREKEMAFDGFRWKVHLDINDGLQPEQSYGFQVVLRTYIENELGEVLPQEQIALRAANPVAPQEVTNQIIYLDRSIPPTVCPDSSSAPCVVQIEPFDLNDLTELQLAIDAGNLLVADNPSGGRSFYLKVDLNNAAAHGYSVLGEITVSWPGTGHPPVNIKQWVNADPESPDYRTVIFEIPITAFPIPGYRAGNPGEPAIVAVPPTYEMNIDLIFEGTDGILHDSGKVIMQNVSPDISFLDQGGNRLGLGRGNHLDNAIAISGPNGEFRTLTLDVDNLDWPAVLKLWKTDPGPSPGPPDYTYSAEMDEATGKITFVLPVDQVEFYYEIILTNPSVPQGQQAQTFTDTGHFDIPETLNPAILTQSILTSMTNWYNEFSTQGPIPNDPDPQNDLYYDPANHTFQIEIGRTAPTLTGTSVPTTIIFTALIVGGIIQPALTAPASCSGMSSLDCLGSIVSNQWDVRLHTVMRVRTTANPPVLKKVQEILNITFPITPKLRPNPQQAINDANEILNEFSSMYETASSQIYKDDYIPDGDSSHRLYLWVSFRDKYCMRGLSSTVCPASGPPANGHYTYPIEIANGIIGGQDGWAWTFSTYWLTNQNITDSNPLYVSITLVETDSDGYLINRFSETSFWGFKDPFPD